MLLLITGDNWLSYQVLMFQQRPIATWHSPSPPVCSGDTWYLVCINIRWMNFSEVYTTKMLLQSQTAITCIVHATSLQHTHWCNLACNFHEMTKHWWTMSVTLATFCNGVNACKQSCRQADEKMKAVNWHSNSIHYSWERVAMWSWIWMFHVMRQYATIPYGDWQSA